MGCLFWVHICKTATFHHVKCFSRRDLPLPIPHTHDVGIFLGCRTSMRPGFKRDVLHVPLITILYYWSKPVLTLTISGWHMWQTSIPCTPEVSVGHLWHFRGASSLCEWIFCNDESNASIFPSSIFHSTCIFYFNFFQSVDSLHSDLSQSVGLSWAAQQLWEHSILPLTDGFMCKVPCSTP